MYGYEIVKAIQSRTKDSFSFGEGCIYPLLHHLEQSRLVSSRRKEVGARSRYYYRLTPRGIKRLTELSEEWKQVAACVSLLMAAKRRSYWWGRHPVVSFVLLPLPMFFLLFLGILWLWGEASGLIAWTEHKEGLAEPDWAAVRVGFYTTLSAALTISAGFICF